MRKNPSNHCIQNDDEIENRIPRQHACIDFIRTLARYIIEQANHETDTCQKQVIDTWNTQVCTRMTDVLTKNMVFHGTAVGRVVWIEMVNEKRKRNIMNIYRRRSIEILRGQHLLTEDSQTEVLVKREKA